MEKDMPTYNPIRGYTGCFKMTDYMLADGLWEAEHPTARRTQQTDVLKAWLKGRCFAPYRVHIR